MALPIPIEHRYQRYCVWQSRVPESEVWNCVRDIGFSAECSEKISYKSSGLNQTALARHGTERLLRFIENFHDKIRFSTATDNRKCSSYALLHCAGHWFTALKLNWQLTWSNDAVSIVRIAFDFARSKLVSFVCHTCDMSIWWQNKTLSYILRLFITRHRNVFHSIIADHYNNIHTPHNDECMPTNNDCKWNEHKNILKNPRNSWYPLLCYASIGLNYHCLLQIIMICLSCLRFDSYGTTRLYSCWDGCIFSPSHHFNYIKVTNANR